MSCRSRLYGSSDCERGQQQIVVDAAVTLPMTKLAGALQLLSELCMGWVKPLVLVFSGFGLVGSVCR